MPAGPFTWGGAEPDHQRAAPDQETELTTEA
jgi:hypothetical protein